MPNGDLTWKEVLIIAAIWIGHLCVLPVLGAAWLLARCPLLPKRARRSCQYFFDRYFDPEG